MTAVVMAVVMVFSVLRRTIYLHREVIVDTAVKNDLQRISRRAEQTEIHFWAVCSRSPQELHTALPSALCL